MSSSLSISICLSKKKISTLPEIQPTPFLSHSRAQIFVIRKKKCTILHLIKQTKVLKKIKITRLVNLLNKD